MQRIEPRGPKDTLCFIPSLVPIKDIIDELIQTRDLDRVTARYPVTADEVFEAIEIYVDQSRSFNDDCIIEIRSLFGGFIARIVVGTPKTTRITIRILVNFVLLISSR